MDLYGEIILDHFKNPRNTGEISGAQISGEDLNPLCGDKVKIWLKVDGGRVKDFSFVGDGCAISVASTSIIGESLKGMTLDELENLENEKVYEMIGVPISPGRVKCALLGITCIKKAIKLYKAEQMARETKKTATKAKASAKAKKGEAEKAEHKLEHLIEETLLEAYSEKDIVEDLHGESHKHSEVSGSDWISELSKKEYLDIINEVLDPETGVGITDMGLIYDVEEHKDGLVVVTMTLTSMGCPAGGQITTEIDSMIRLQPHVTDVKIEVVWSPPWNPEMMNPDVKVMLFGNGNMT